MFDITKRRAMETAEIELVTGDGGPLTDDEGNRLSVTICGPASKTWQAADAERNRRRALRAEKNPRKIASAMMDNAREDEADFLVAITVSFNGWEYPAPDGKKWPTQGAMFRAAYDDDSIGFIRDHIAKESGDWSAFTNGSGKA